ncbi:MAG: hypothetical protein U0599_16445 [Vicinamibacteria bacterium]
MIVEEEAVGRLVRRLESLGVPYMVAGSVASSHHGLPRATNDADIVIDPTPEGLEALVTALAADGYYVDAKVARDALRARRLFNVIDPESAFKVDLIIRKERPFSREEFSRRERRDLGGLAASVATPEDTILSKLEWARKGGGSDRQIEDALGVLRVGADRIDRSYIARWAAALGVEDLWQGLVDRLRADRGPGR